MRRLQKSIIYLIVLLIILFNIERLDVGNSNVNNLATGVYVLTSVAVLLILTIKWFRTLPQSALVLLWGSAFLFTKAIWISHRPLVGGIYTYLSFTELSLFIIAVLLSQNLARNLGEIERKVNSFTFASLPKIKLVEDAQERIQAEIYRSRRFQRPLSIVVLEREKKNNTTQTGADLQNAQQALLEEYLSALLVRDLAAQLRQTDFLLEHYRKGRLIIVSPDTDQTGVNNLIERLSPLTQSQGIFIHFGAATFPEHGYTFEQLLEKAEIDLKQRMESRVNLNTPEKIEKNQALM